MVVDNGLIKKSNLHLSFLSKNAAAQDQSTTVKCFVHASLILIE